MTPFNFICIGMVVLSIMTGLIQIWGLGRFQQLMFLPIIKRRFPRIVQTEARLLMLMLSIVIPITFLNKIWIGQLVSDGDRDIASHLQLLQNILSAIINPACSYFLSHIEAMRLWLLFYELQLLQSLQDEDWGKKIMSNFWRHDFYLRHRHTRGNVRWVSKWLFLYWATMSTVSGFIGYYVLLHDVHIAIHACFQLVKTMLLFFPLVFIAYLWKRAPTKQCDALMIEEEFNATCYVVAVGVVCYAISFLLMELGQELAMYTAVGISWIFTAAAPSLVATVWMPGRLSQRMISMHGATLCSGMVLDKGLFKDRDLNADGSRVGTIHGELEILYKSEPKMKALGSWMIRRFAAESFLCFIEMVQFKERVVQMIKKRNPKFSERSVVRQRHHLYNHCPRSSIVFNSINRVRLQELGDEVVVEVMEEVKEETVVEIEEEEKKTAGTDSTGCTAPGGTDTDIIFELEEDIVRSLRQSAHLIFEKYVDSRTDLAINIGHQMRQHHCALYKDHYASLSSTEWITLYDDVLAVLEDYIVQSYMTMIRKLKEIESG